jgi:hypothetical protein
MPTEQSFEIALWLSIFVPISITGALFVMPRPRRASLRALLAILAGWIAFVLMAVLVYNPARIAFSHAAGEHFPEARFDNNTIATAVLGGWVYPALMCLVVALVRVISARIQRWRKQRAVV